MQKRKQVIVNPSIQYKLIGFILVVTVIPIIALFIGLTYYTNVLITKVPVGNDQIVALLDTIQKINFSTFGSFLIIIILLTIVETMFLHRIIGPLYRIEMDLEEILSTKEFNKKIKIRDTDYLQPLTEKINGLLSLLSNKE